MTILLQCLAALVVLAVTPLPLYAQLDAPTGQYAGTLVHVRRLTVLNTDPPRVVTFKKKTKVVGFGTVRTGTGETRTYIRLIVPPGAQQDGGDDQELIVDFNPNPPTFTVLTPSAISVVGFPNITVDGNVVTVQTLLSNSDATTKLEDDTTLVLKLKKPL